MASPDPPTDGATATEARGQVEAGVRLRDRHGLILLLLIGVYVLGGIAESWARVLALVTFLAVVMLALWVPGLPPRMRRVGAPAALLILVAAIVLELIGGTAGGYGFVLFACVELLVFVAILARIAQHSHVHVETVMGALAGYVMIGFIMSSVYLATDTLSSQPFFVQPAQTGDFVYFSFVTLTTTGYGDFTPATLFGKRLVVVEALIGQIFLLTLVARLVSLWGQPFERAARRFGRPESAEGGPPADR